MLISHSQATAFPLFFNDIPHFVRRDIFAFAKVILRLRRSDIQFASSTAARQYHSAESRISLRSNRTRRKANRTEKSTCNSKCFFLAGVAESDKASLVACNNFMSLLLRKRWTIGSNPTKQSKTKNSRCKNASEKLITTRNRVVAKQSRCEGVYNRTGDLSVTCFGKEERRRE